MANKDQINLVQLGPESWNKWRIENPNERIELSKADLRQVNLIGANLSEANLSGAILIKARLSESVLCYNLRDAILNQAKLNQADRIKENLKLAKFTKHLLSDFGLTGAVLNRANLEFANLSEADLRWTDLIEANLSHADLTGADLTGANLKGANLNHADLKGIDLTGASLTQADFTMAKLCGADLTRAILNRANLNETDLTEAKLSEANLVEAKLEKANLTGCGIYGISAWGLKLKDAIQKDLVITPENEPLITVDNLEVAQFIYVLLHNEKIRDVIDTITSKVVLILGRFTGERKPVLEAIREELRNRGYLPVLFDFKGPASRDTRETVSILAHMSRFIIADISNARSISAELECIVPQLPSVAVQPLMHSSDEEYGLFEHIRRYPWVLETYKYKTQRELLASLEEKVIGPAEAKANELILGR